MSETSFVLIIEDEVEYAEAMAERLRREGHACRVVQSKSEAMESVQARRPDVIVAESKLGKGGNGFDLIKEAKRFAPDAEVIVMGSDDEEALKGKNKLPANLEVFEYIIGSADPEEINKVVARASEQAQRNRELRALQEQADRRSEFEGIITSNEQMIRLINMLRRVADSKLTILVIGDSGTGKELVARAIHRHSPRQNNPYRAINCAGLNENLLESELFGHVKGAFTGAVADRKGLFEVVDGGTLFLDEIGDMPMSMQAKLLRTLENGEVLPVGGNDIRQVDVRVVAATRRDLRAMVEENDFRDDLFYRLNQAMIRIPPLRERREDIPLLIEHFLEQAAQAHGKTVTSITPEAVRQLSSYSWPGNVRELRSVINQMVVLADKPRLELEDLPDHLRSSTDIVLASGPSTAGLTMEQMERIHISNTLKLTGGNREKTAKILGIGARTLYRKLREYDL